MGVESSSIISCSTRSVPLKSWSIVKSYYLPMYLVSFIYTYIYSNNALCSSRSVQYSELGLEAWWPLISNRCGMQWLQNCFHGMLDQHENDASPVTLIASGDDDWGINWSSALDILLRFLYSVLVWSFSVPLYRQVLVEVSGVEGLLFVCRFPSRYVTHLGSAFAALLRRVAHSTFHARCGSRVRFYSSPWMSK
jgi:hypothetical protein